MQNKAEQDRNQDATVYLGNLDEKCTDALVWELMLSSLYVSASPHTARIAASCTCQLEHTQPNIFLPKDRISMAHQGFGFCEFLSEDDADYACKILNQIKLYGKPIRVSKASYDKKQLDVGANLFIGSLPLDIDEAQLYDTFQRFGTIADQPKIARDPTSGAPKGYGFVSFHDFDAADMAIENMNGQFLGGKQISVQYAFKKDGKGERHGTAAERLLANQAKKHAMMPGPAAPISQGQFAGALSAAQAQAAAFAPNAGGIPPPPPGMPVYQPPPQAAYGAPDGYGGMPAMQGMPGVPTGANGYGYPPPPAGFAPQGYPLQGAYGQAPPQQAYGQAPPQAYGQVPPPPIRMGFNGPGQ